MTFGIVASSGPIVTAASWTDLTFSNSWDNYGGTYSNAGWLQHGDVTYCRGLIDSGTTTKGTVVSSAQLPSPSASLIFPETSAVGFASMDVESDGDLVTRTANHVWTTLSRIIYVDGDTSMTAPTLVNSWADYGLGFDGAGYHKDSDGNVIIQGLVKSGTSTKGTTMFTLPSGYRPTGGYEIFPATRSGDGYAAIDVRDDGNVVTRFVSTTWTSLSGINFNVDVSWTAPSLQNSWVNYGSGYAGAGYAKDDSGVVHLRGLIKSGGTTNGTEIFTLPSGYRPSEDMIVLVPNANTSDADNGQIFIRSTGEVQIRVAPGNTWLSLAGVSFPAA